MYIKFFSRNKGTELGTLQGIMIFDEVEKLQLRNREGSWCGWEQGQWHAGVFLNTCSIDRPYTQRAL